MRHAGILLLGYLLDCLIGEPQNPVHPVRLIAAAASGFERLFRRLCGRRLRLAGALTWVLTVTVSFGTAALLLWGAWLLHPAAYFLAGGAVAYFCVAPRGLDQEARRVLKRLDAGDLPGARESLSRIVGRDTDALGAEEIRRAVIETVAENFSDGVAAPFLFLIPGPAWAVLYKAVNTMDSMFGYRNEKYREFGWAPARLDDLFNLLPARISALLVVLATPLCGLSVRDAFRVWRRDRKKHLSPNSAHPEAAFAGALGISMGGTHDYGGVPVEKPTIGDGRNPAGRKELLASLKLLRAATLLCVLLCAAGSAGLGLLFAWVGSLI